MQVPVGYVIWRLRRMLAGEQGSVLGEYGLWIFLVVIAAAGALTALSGQLTHVVKSLCDTLGGSC